MGDESYARCIYTKNRLGEAETVFSHAEKLIQAVNLRIPESDIRPIPININEPGSGTSLV